MIKMIAAHDTNKGIGIDNKLPWHLPEDLAHFKRETEGKYVLMGRKTFESIGRPLPNRHSVVLTRDTDWPYNSDLARFWVFSLVFWVFRRNYWEDKTHSDVTKPYGRGCILSSRCSTDCFRTMIQRNLSDLLVFFC